MTLEGITIAGVDESVGPLALGMLSAEYPFIEWAVLYSEKRVGTPRYPNGNWLVRLLKLAEIQPMNLSLHLCGQIARDFMEHARHPFTPDMFFKFKRVQINGYEPGMPIKPIRLGWHANQEYILQCREEVQLERAVEESVLASTHGAVRVLFDPSGGTGWHPGQWPAAPQGVRMGYAGGIKLSNIERVVSDIERSRRGTPLPFWIDLESGARSEKSDRIELETVRHLVRFVDNYRRCNP